MAERIINLEQAQKIVIAALAEGRALGLKPISVAVLDPGGHLVAFSREDKSSNLRPQIAIAKASGALVRQRTELVNALRAGIGVAARTTAGGGDLRCAGTVGGAAVLAQAGGGCRGIAGRCGFTRVARRSRRIRLCHGCGAAWWISRCLATAGHLHGAVTHGGLARFWCPRPLFRVFVVRGVCPVLRIVRAARQLLLGRAADAALFPWLDLAGRGLFPLSPAV